VGAINIQQYATNRSLTDNQMLETRHAWVNT